MYQYNFTCFYSYDSLCRLISFIRCFNVICCYLFHNFFFSLEKYDQIPTHIESKLLPFQRDGVRYVAVAYLWDQCYISCIKHYVFCIKLCQACSFSIFRFALQHGGRILLADEMGLGKTLQAIGYLFEPFHFFWCLLCESTGLSNEYSWLASCKMTCLKLAYLMVLAGYCSDYMCSWLLACSCTYTVILTFALGLSKCFIIFYFFSKANFTLNAWTHLPCCRWSNNG